MGKKDGEKGLSPRGQRQQQQLMNDEKRNSVIKLKKKKIGHREGESRDESRAPARKKATIMPLALQKKKRIGLNTLQKGVIS